MTVTGDGPLVVREKAHAAAPMTLDQALYEMELVGHDFYLFVDKESEKPSVVYRRRGYDYGVISLDAGLIGSPTGHPRRGVVRCDHARVVKSCPNGLALCHDDANAR